MRAIGIRIRVRVRVGVNQTVETAVDTPTGKQSVVSLTKVLTKSYPSHSSRKYRYRKAGELVFELGPRVPKALLHLALK